MIRETDALWALLVVCLLGLGWAIAEQRTELEQLRAQGPDTVVVHVDHGAVDLTELGGVYCHAPPGGGLTTADP